MTNINLLYDACQDLFSEHSAAIDGVSDTRESCSMILMLRDGDDARFFVLTCDYAEDRPIYYIRPWRGHGTVEIEAKSTGTVPDVVADVVEHGIPIPREGSLLGWLYETEVTALIIFHTRHEPGHPEPSWAVMPRADIPEALWPPFTGEPVLGNWFWKDFGVKRIVSLDQLIADRPDTVFWIDTEFSRSRGCCAVAHSVIAEDGSYTLGNGCYMYYQELRAGTPAPPLDALLAEAGRIDLALRFEVATH